LGRLGVAGKFSYEGMWANDMKNGRGIFTYTNKDLYDGNWLNN